MIRIFIFFVAASSLMGCSSLKTTFVNPSIESPIVGGTPKQYGFGLGTLSAHEYEFTSDASRRPPFLTTPTISSTTSPFAEGHFVLVENFQVGLELHPFDFSLEPKVKYQIFGDKQAGFQVSTYARVGFSTTSKSGDQNGEFGAGGYNWEGKAQGYSYSAGLSLGYFINEAVMAYLGSSYGQMKAKATIDHAASSDGSSSAASYSVEDNGDVWAIGGGLSFGKITPLTIGLVYTEVDYDKVAADHQTQSFISLSF